MSPATNPKPSVFIGPIVQVQELKKFLITGHGRSGTNYMAHLFRWFGYSVGAQADDNDGQAHNYPADIWPFKKAREKYQYLIQVVRNPVLVVESTYTAGYSLPRQYALTRGNRTKTINGRIPEILQGHDELVHAVRSLVLWNRAIAEAKPDLVVKVEEAPSVCRGWLVGLGLEVAERGPKPPDTDINKRKSEGWNLDKITPWGTLPDNAREMFVNHCHQYGYPDNIP